MDEVTKDSDLEEIPIEEIDETTLKIKGKASITRQLFNQTEREVFSINFKALPGNLEDCNLAGKIAINLIIFEEYICGIRLVIFFLSQSLLKFQIF